jgi:hypothetical protein
VSGRKRRKLVALSELSPIGLQDTANPTFSIGGHLIAVQLTGVDEPENICPVSKQTNDKMQAVENQIAKLAQQAHYLEVTVASYWDDKDPRIPKQFDYVLKGRDKTKEVLKATVTQEWLAPMAYGYDQARIATFAAIDKQCRESKWAIENISNTPVGNRDLRFLKGHLPPLDKRPYAFLDYWLVEMKGEGFTPPLIDQTKVLEYINSIGVKQNDQRVNFGPVGRQLAIIGCILRHNNRLLSDAFGNKDAMMQLSDKTGKITQAVIEVNQVLIEGGGYNAPQVDHIVPDNQGGATCLSNAQVTSMQYNSAKQDATEFLALRSDEWKQKMILAQKADLKLGAFVVSPMDIIK